MIQKVEIVYKKSYKLAIESGIGGGSVSVLETENETERILDYWLAIENASKADQLLQGISDILSRNRIQRKHIREILYSAYPGSYTGLKIGAAIAKGLATSLDLCAVQRDLFDSISKKIYPEAGDSLLIFLPVSVSELEWRFYIQSGLYVDSGRIKRHHPGRDWRRAEFEKGITIYAPMSLITNHEAIFTSLTSEIDVKVKVEDTGENLSGFIGLY